MTRREFQMIRKQYTTIGRKFQYFQYQDKVLDDKKVSDYNKKVPDQKNVSNDAKKFQMIRREFHMIKKYPMRKNIN